MIQFHVRKDQFGVMIHDTEYVNGCGQVARNLMYELVRAEIGKAMSSAIREQAYAGIKAQPMAKLACDLAEALWDEMLQRKLIAVGPTMEELEASHAK